MRVYVDSNFLLELALHQAQARDAHEILNFAQTGIVELVCPATAICEPLSNMGYRRLERLQLRTELGKFANELDRSDGWGATVQSVQRLLTEIDNVSRVQSDELQRELIRLLECASILPLDSGTIKRSRFFQQKYELKLADAILAASIVQELERQQQQAKLADSIFVCLDRKDFSKIRGELDKFQCSFIPSFGDAVKRIVAEPQLPI